MREKVTEQEWLRNLTVCQQILNRYNTELHGYVEYQSEHTIAFFGTFKDSQKLGTFKIKFYLDDLSQYKLTQLVFSWDVLPLNGELKKFENPIVVSMVKDVSIVQKLAMPHID